MTDEIEDLRQIIEKRQIEYDKIKLESEEYFHTIELENIPSFLDGTFHSIFERDMSEEEIDAELSYLKNTIKEVRDVK